MQQPITGLETGPDPETLVRDADIVVVNSMTLADYIAMLGAGVEDGLIDRHEAARLLQEYADGRLTLRGAYWELDDHSARSVELRQTLADAARTLDVFDALQRAETEQDREAALTAFEAINDRRRACAREAALRLISRPVRRDDR
ncbi:hypothetical protein [Thermomonospora umbrina]|uniref:Uncharacterized protein n=1 Tax=Thermomonospora umbrina TaxID=111806 RepID=A0A3D9T6H3_9ACTN|nr:hypothetical protein [Thermomonospora umbrina]REF00255.1 hypothetical protein DFJ69_5783 [Thermomonospora umbrina]